MRAYVGLCAFARLRLWVRRCAMTVGAIDFLRRRISIEEISPGAEEAKAARLEIRPAEVRESFTSV